MKKFAPLALLLLVLGAATIGCKKPEDKPAAPAGGAEPAAATPAEPAPAEGGASS